MFTFWSDKQIFLYGSWHPLSFKHMWYFEAYLENLLLLFSCKKSENWFTWNKFKLFHPDKLFKIEGTALSLTSTWQQQTQISRINNCFNLNKVH